MPVRAGRVSGGELIVANAAQASGSIPAPWKPSAFEAFAASGVVDDFEAIPGGFGLVRSVEGIGVGAGSSDFEAAASEAEFIARADVYFARSEVQIAVARGTLAVTVHTAPTYLRSATTLYTSGTVSYVPADNTEGGAWQGAMTLFIQRAKAILGPLYRAPRNAQGQIEIGQPGILWECGNEWGGGTGTQLANAKTTYKRFWQGIIDEDPDAGVILPGPVDYSVTEGTGKTFIREMCEFAGANACPPHAVVTHGFQGGTGPYALVPTVGVAGAAAEFTAALAAGSLSASTPRVMTEFQCNLSISFGGPDARNNYHAASFFASSIWEHWQAGIAGMVMATLWKLGDVPPDSAPFAESGTFAGWGMITKSTARIPTAQFSLMTLFSLWDGGLALPAQSRPRAQIRSFCAVNGNDVIVLAARWSGAGTIPLDIRAVHPGKTFVEARVYRIDALTNNVQKVFADTVGTDLEKGAAARAAGLAPTYTTTTENPVRLQFASTDTVLVRFMFA